MIYIKLKQVLFQMKIPLCIINIIWSCMTNVMSIFSFYFSGGSSGGFH